MCGWRGRGRSTYRVPMVTVVSASHIAWWNGSRHVLVRDGHVVVDGPRIVGVGPGPGPGPELTGERFDLGEALLMPGLIDLDALTDIDHLILDNWLDPVDARAATGAAAYWAGDPQPALTAEQREVMRRFALAQLALHGITSYMPIAAEVHTGWAEDVEDLRRMGEISREIGLRGWIGPSYRSSVIADGGEGRRQAVVDEERGWAGLRDAVAFAQELRELEHSGGEDADLLHPVLLPCRIETVTEEILRASAQEAARLGIPVRLHCLQQLFERELLAERDGATPLELLERTGLLGGHLLIPHGLYIDRHPAVHGEDRGDLGRLAAAGVSIIHCPLTTFRYGDVLDSVARYQDAGVGLCLGTDSFPPDLLRGMDVGVHAGRILHGRDSVSLARYLEAATIGGAQALRRPDLGRIAEGATADLVAFRLDDFRTGVLEDPLRTLVFNASARTAQFSMVGGRPVVRDGELPGMDLSALRREAQEVFDTMREAYTRRDARGRSMQELFEPVLPPA